MLEDNNFGSVIVIAYVLMIIVQSVKLYRLCHEKESDMYDGLQRIGLVEKLVINRSIRQHAPELSKENRRKLLNCIVSKAQELDFDEFRAILKEIGNLKG